MHLSCVCNRRVSSLVRTPPRYSCRSCPKWLLGAAAVDGFTADGAANGDDGEGRGGLVGDGAAADVVVVAADVACDDACVADTLADAAAVNVVGADDVADDAAVDAVGAVGRQLAAVWYQVPMSKYGVLCRVELATEASSIDKPSAA